VGLKSPVVSVINDEVEGVWKQKYCLWSWSRLLCLLMNY